jgi:hypothetical protein
MWANRWPWYQGRAAILVDVDRAPILTEKEFGAA